ncbi:extracellular catalytic domain type 1 short-chain-length polyhydroxyalkanoate depolymerase [Nonomuraea composti]|uniref:extracellular catalytic domain type 1 short-chain-length polyhydroxyalkanoate depolymerase n=1 Tax=Nonomuraea composti TaxID=2720023 RepID=UPI001F105D4D|nr:PHB depolymerase family esterase [Nonomuraea sp. FMUSA5-5]
MRRLTKALAGACAAALFAVMTVVLGSPAAAASLVEVTSFGNNPGNMRMHVYVPDSRPASPAIVVAMHGCGGSGPGFYQGSEFASLADRYGFVVIYPSATQSAGFGNCFDTWSDAAKRRGGGSDPVSIISMIEYVERTYQGDPNRVYATGSSSGGMMTQHMLALYPDVFKAGASFMGVPFNCFAGASDYPPGSSKCTGGSMDRTPQQWGDAVRQAYPGYSGPRPRIQLWHGTADTLVPYSLLRESIEQWTNVFGLSQTPTSTDTPQSGWSRSRYADASGTVQVEAYSIQGAGHVLPQSGMAMYAVQFFGLTTSQTDTTPPTTPGTPVASNVTATSATLTWTASTDQGGSGLAGYNVYREQGATDPQLGQSTTASITLTGLSANTQYQVYVRARDGAGNLSGNSAPVTFTTTATGGDTTPPTAPAGLTASGTTATATTLTWTASTDDTGVTAYEILRAPGATGGTFTQAGTSATTSFTDTGLTASTTYRYQVRARDAAGNISPVSGTVQVTTQAGTTGTCSATATVQSQWGTGYVIQPLTVTNTSTSTINSWTVTFTLPAGHTLTGSWNATVTTSGQTVTLKSVGHNGTLAPGASTTSVGFQASRPSGNTALPSGYTCA